MGNGNGCLALSTLRERLREALKAQAKMRVEMHQGSDTGSAVGAQLARANAHVEILEITISEIVTGKGEERCYG